MEKDYTQVPDDNIKTTWALRIIKNIIDLLMIW